MKIIKNWKFVVIITILALFGLYVANLYIQDARLPSKDWSKDIQLQNVVKGDNEIILGESVYTLPIPEANVFITFWYDNKHINYSVISDTGEVVSSNIIARKFDDIRRLHAVLNSDNISLYTIEDGELNRYEFDWNNNNILEEATLSNEVIDFAIEEGLLVSREFDSLKIIDENNVIKLAESIKAQDISITKYNDIYYIAYIETSGIGSQELKYMTFNSKEQATHYKIRNLIFNVKGQLNIGIAHDNINIIVPTWDKLNMKVVGHVYTFPIGMPEAVTHNYIREFGSANTLKIINGKSDKLQFIMPSTILKGSNNSSLDLLMYTYENGDIVNKRLLTKTDNNSFNPILFTLNGNEYLQWVDKRVDDITIYFASNNEEIISQSQKYSFSDWTSLLLNTLISLGAVAFAAIMPICAILAPTALIITAWSCFKIYWVEQNPLKVFAPSFVIHNAIKILYVIFLIFSNRQLLFSLPNYLRNPVMMSIVLLLTTLLSLYSTLNFAKKHSNYFAIYTFYAVIDLIFLSMVIYPYYASFKLFSYMTVFF